LHDSAGQECPRSFKILAMSIYRKYPYSHHGRDWNLDEEGGGL